MINYISIWDKIKEKTWSGTTHSLLNALAKQELLNEVDITLNKAEICIVKIFKITGNKVFNKFEYYLYSNKIKKKISKNIASTNIYIGDSGSLIKGGYIYQDLSISILEEYKKNKTNLFQYSGFQLVKDRELQWRKKKQLINYHNLDGIFTMSKWLESHLKNCSEISNDKVHYVGAGVNVDINKIEDSQKYNNKILFIGRDFQRKGGDLVVEAFKVLKKEIPTLELYILGPKINPLNEEINDIHFIGDVPKEEVSYYLNKCDVFCMPSRFEAFGLVFIEALVYGLPCIGRNDFAMPEFIEHGINGFLIEDDDINKLAFYIKEILTNKKYKTNVQKNRDFYINNYSWDKVANRIFNIIEEKKKG